MRKVFLLRQPIVFCVCLNQCKTLISFQFFDYIFWIIVWVRINFREIKLFISRTKFFVLIWNKIKEIIFIKIYDQTRHFTYFLGYCKNANKICSKFLLIRAFVSFNLYLDFNSFNRNRFNKRPLQSKKIVK